MDESIRSPLDLAHLHNGCSGSGTALNGVVKDGTGAVIPGATVTLTFQGYWATRTTLTGSDGNFTFQQLDPGATASPYR